jgi:hypothetical protein
VQGAAASSTTAVPPPPSGRYRTRGDQCDDNEASHDNGCGDDGSDLSELSDFGDDDDDIFGGDF